MLNLALGFRQKIGDWLNERKNISFPTSFAQTLDMVRSIIVLAQVDTPQREKSNNTLKSELKKICPAAKQQWLCFRQRHSSNEDSYISADSLRYVSDNDFSFWFKFTNQDLVNTLSSQYDMMIVFADTPDVLINFTVRYVMSGLRIGKSNGSQPACDTLNFIVNVPPSAPQDDSVKYIVENLNMIFQRRN